MQCKYIEEERPQLWDVCSLQDVIERQSTDFVDLHNKL